MAEATRDPTSVKQVGGEVTVLMSLGMVVVHYVSKLDPEMPEMVEQAIIGLVIAGGSMLLSHMRDRKHTQG